MDLDAANEAGHGDDSTTEVAVRAAASMADKALSENRAVGLTVSAHRMTVVPADRGARQRLKILQLLAAVEADGRTPLAEALVTGVNRLRRGMTAIVVTSSQDASFVRPLATLRTRGIGAVVVLLDPAQFEPDRDEAAAEAQRQRTRAVRHALVRVRDPDLRHQPAAGPRGGAGAMTIDAHPRPPSRGGLAHARARDGDGASSLAWAVDDPAWVNGKGELTDVLQVCRRARRRVRVRRAQARLGPLDDAPRRRAVRGPADPDPRRASRPCPNASPARRSSSPPTARSPRTSTSRGAGSGSRARRSTTSWSWGSCCGRRRSSARSRCSGTGGRSTPSS